MKFFPLPFLAPQNLKQHVANRDLPVMLFERTAHMKGLQKEFAKLLTYSKKKREKWLEDHQDYIQEMLEKIRQESTIMVSEFAFNDLARRTVTEYMVTVQQTLVTLEKVVYEADVLMAD